MKDRDIGPLFKHLWQEPPKILYHYTGVDVLEKLTNPESGKGKLWATDTRYLNDRTELIEARRFITELLIKRTSKNASGRKKVLSDLKQIEHRNKGDEVFVTSFSSRGDSLPQWRAYCSKGSGVAIGFRSSSICDALLESGGAVIRSDDDDDGVASSRPTRCVYTNKEKKDLVSEQMEGYLSIALGTHPRLTPARSLIFLSTLLDMCSPLFKHESFREEEEWRVVVVSRHPNFPKRHFRPGLSTLVPYITLDVANKTPARYISRVVIGPTPHEQLAKLSIDKLLFTRGLISAKVDNSEIPYRSW